MASNRLSAGCVSQTAEVGGRGAGGGEEQQYMYLPAPCARTFGEYLPLGGLGPPFLGHQISQLLEQLFISVRRFRSASLWLILSSGVRL